MNARRSALAAAIAIAIACSSTYALEQTPSNPILPDTLPSASPGVKAQAAAEHIADIEIGHLSAGFGLDPALRKVFVTNYGSGTLSSIDVDTRQVTTFDVGRNPRRMSYNAALQRAYIVNDTTPGTVTVFDTKEGRVLATVPVGDRPRNIAADFQRGEVYVSNFHSNTMSVIATATNEVVATFSVGSQPFMGEVDGTRGFVYVLSQIDRVMHVIDTQRRQVVAQVNTGTQPNGATVDGRTGKVYVNNTLDRSITIVDPVAKTVKMVPGIGAGSTFGTISTVFKRYYLPNATDHTVTILDTDTDEIVKTVPVGASPQQVTADSNDGDLYVVNRLSNSVTILDQRSETVTGTVPTGINPWRVYTGLGLVFALNENGSARDSVTIVSQADTLAGTTLATEWYHPYFDHYFHSANGIENRLLNDGIYGNAWKRTFDVFRVWTTAGPGRVGVCRFFNDSFGDMSSHVYVLEGEECDLLKAGNEWKFEEIAYYVEAPYADGACRAGTMPIYRAYNNGMSGAPNHIITASKTKRDGLVSAGWVAEGHGEDHVAACVPSPRGDEF